MKSNKTVFTTLGASSHSTTEREGVDFYATQPRAVEMLLELEEFNNNILEPFCGLKHISNTLENAGYKVTSTDMIDRDNEVKVYDKYTIDELKNQDIITNPPYKYGKEIVEFFMDRLEEGAKLAMFLKLQFLEGKARKKLFAKYPPKTIYVSSSRLGCAKNGEFDVYGTSGAVCYCWYIWEKGFEGTPEIKWFN